MPSYTEPTNDAFTAAEQTTLDLLNTSYPEMQTKAGSVIRELLVRPFAYLYAWCRTNLAAYRREASVQYLQTSQLTENAIADAIASNYFVTRKQGERSHGAITLITTTPALQIQAGDSFTANGVQLIAQYRTIGAIGATRGLRNGVMYVPLIPLDNTYSASVPVETTMEGDIEIDAGAPVTMGFSYSGIVSAELTSPISGGSGTETDAQLMRRAEYNTAASGVGSWYGIRRLLNDCPVNVMDFGLLAGEDKLLYRARYNTININPGGYADVYVKTQRQAAVGELHASLTVTQGQDNTSVGRAVFTQTSSISGVISVQQLVVAGTVINDYTVEYGSSDPETTASGARLGASQTITVTFGTTASNGVDVTAYVRYMPGVTDIQNYMNQDTNAFIGQDVMIKSAVPVLVHLDCIAKAAEPITDDQMTLIKSTLYDTVNAIPVGAGKVNFSDLRKAVAAAVPSVELRLPCTMSVEVPLPDGGNDAFYSTSGILDITHPVHPDTWDPAICFFCLIPDYIRIEEI